MVNTSFPLLSVPLSIILAYLPHFLRVALILRHGKHNNTNPRDHATQHASVPPTIAAVATRLAACHQNQLELLGVYAAGIVACVAVNEDDNTLIILSALYLAFRAAFVVAYAAPQIARGYLRTLAFTPAFAVVFLIWGKAAFS